MPRPRKSASPFRYFNSSPEVTRTSEAKPGMRLTREWNGKLHTVSVGEGGTIRWNERDWKSLSEVARAITGTCWSGPAFFSLKTKRKAAA